MLVFLYEPVEIFGGVLAAVGIALLVEVYIQEKALSAWLMVGNYIVLSVLYLFALKLTDSARLIVDAATLDNPLIKEVSLMNLREAENHRMLQVMLVVQKSLE